MVGVRAVKVRFGVGLGVNQLLAQPSDFAVVVDQMEALGFDSLWMSERVVGPAPDPLAALSFAAGRTSRLKLGTNVLVLPGRNPVVLAKQLATIDQLSGGRLLPVLGLGTSDPNEHHAFDVDPSARGRIFDESLATMRAVWSIAPASVGSRSGVVRTLAVYPKPVRRLSVWLGGRSPGELRRVGRLGDGWLASFQSPAETGAARVAIEAAASGAGREIEPDHFGTVMLYERRARSDRAVQLVRRQCPDAPLATMLPRGAEELRAAVRAYVAAGITKFVMIPGSPPGDWSVELAWLRSITGGLEM
jgi:probable F420-dependent oxidoreductase